jgi:hypothetical protein
MSINSGGSPAPENYSFLVSKNRLNQKIYQTHPKKIKI